MIARRVAVNGTTLHVVDHGGDGPPLVFSHGLLWSGQMFDAQVAALQDRYRCITYDHRGQGQSAKDGGTKGSVPIETNYDDCVALLEELDLGPVHLAGLSMGGFVAMRVAARRADLVRSIVLMATAADPEPAENVPKYRRMCTVVRWLGTWAVASRVMPIMFGDTFLGDESRAGEHARWRRQLLANERSIVRAVQGVCERAGVEGELGAVTVPTLILSGAEDRAIVPERMDRLHVHLPDAIFARVPEAGHSMTIENPDAVSDLMGRFLDSV